MSYLLEEVHRWLLSQQRRKQIPSSCGVLAHQLDLPDCKTKSVIIGRVHVNEQTTKHLFSGVSFPAAVMFGEDFAHVGLI